MKKFAEDQYLQYSYRRISILHSFLNDKMFKFLEAVPKADPQNNLLNASVAHFFMFGQPRFLAMNYCNSTYFQGLNVEHFICSPRLAATKCNTGHTRVQLSWAKSPLYVQLNMSKKVHQGLIVVYSSVGNCLSQKQVCQGKDLTTLLT